MLEKALKILVIHPPLPAFDPFGTSGIDSSISQYGDVAKLAINIVNFAVSFVSIIAIIMIVLGGFWYLTAAGNEEQANKGKKFVLYAIIGIVLIALAYVIVNTVTGAVSSGFETE